jgi:hypothetical protein
MNQENTKSSQNVESSDPRELSKEELQGASGGANCYVSPITAQKKRPMDQATHDQKKRKSRDQ